MLSELGFSGNSGDAKVGIPMNQRGEVASTGLSPLPSSRTVSRRRHDDESVPPGPARDGYLGHSGQAGIGKKMAIGRSRSGLRSTWFQAGFGVMLALASSRCWARGQASSQSLDAY